MENPLIHKAFKKLISSESTLIIGSSSGYSQTAHERINWYKLLTSDFTSGNLSKKNPKTWTAM